MRIAARTAAALAALLLLFAGCRREVSVTGSRTVSFRNANLVTQFRSEPSSDRQIPLVHILFVPVVEPGPDSGFTLFSGSGGTREELKFEHHHHELDRKSDKLEIRARPVYVRNLQTLEADGQSFALARGAVFVVHVALDGGVRIVQLPGAAQDLEPVALLESIQQHLPGDARVQALTSAAAPPSPRSGR